MYSRSSSRKVLDGPPSISDFTIEGGTELTIGNTYPITITLSPSSDLADCFYAFDTETQHTFSDDAASKSQCTELLGISDKTEYTAKLQASGSAGSFNLFIQVVDREGRDNVRSKGVTLLLPLPTLSILEHPISYFKHGDPVTLPVSTNWNQNDKEQYSLKFVKQQHPPSEIDGYINEATYDQQNDQYTITAPNSIDSDDKNPIYIALIKTGSDEIISPQKIENIFYCIEPKILSFKDSNQNDDYQYFAEQTVSLEFEAKIFDDDATIAQPQYQIEEDNAVDIILEKKGSKYTFTYTTKENIPKDENIKITLTLTDKAGQSVSKEVVIHLRTSPHIYGPTFNSDKSEYSTGDVIVLVIKFENFDSREGKFMYRFNKDDFKELDDSKVTTLSKFRNILADPVSYQLSIPSPENIQEGENTLEVKLAQGNDQPESNVVSQKITFVKAANPEPVDPTPEKPIPTPSPKGGLSGGQIAGIVFGVLLGIVIIVLIVYFVFCKKSQEKSSEELEESGSGVEV
ncbi:P270 surface immunogen-like [Trichomonas vaginalis G3]|uniref:P270 surface immunogen-like n=1 Tax=Trichomonas vaginalis (strain ATCC PRA-98 / G3) TaxID=412133 RepID=A2E7I1_TRIV3|nr:surface immunogen P270 [Trichomonas vaginalis G3]EAY11374.1 P270 surface immunogen-like [Trichomonas vaginalis G3]KAI5530539.1 surface immunogen P270 [Trichomonas vaginalis G3]|eukprot:XP_001323597.1 P270 surface immunogen-like [Trichomonas vaginalis G3]